VPRPNSVYQEVLRVLVLSWLGAIAACLGYGVSSVLQSVAAKRSAEVVGLTGIVLIIKQVPYLLGLAADTIAFTGNVVALQRLPLFLVQSIVAGSVGVTAVIASLRGARLSWKDWTSLAILGLGLVLLCVTAVPTAATQISVIDDWTILLASTVPLVVGLFGFRMKNRASAIVMSCAAGLGFSGVALASRGIGATGISWSLLSDPLLWAIIVHGAIGIGFFTVALQRDAVTLVTAITLVFEVVVPSLIGIMLFGDAIAVGFTSLAIAGFALAIGGAVLLSRFSE
jgi:drug/metabolite transporter (DMT)-like permease